MFQSLLEHSSPSSPLVLSRERTSTRKLESQDTKILRLSSQSTSEESRSRTSETNLFDSHHNLPETGGLFFAKREVPRTRRWTLGLQRWLKQLGGLYGKKQLTIGFPYILNIPYPGKIVNTHKKKISISFWGGLCVLIMELCWNRKCPGGLPDASDEGSVKWSAYYY